jgi:hypothetical protein
MPIPNLNTVKEKVLSERHRTMLEEDSGIYPEVIEARGYWTAESVVDLESEPGIKPNQHHVPALVLPIYGVDGTYKYSRVRPDQPPPESGKYLQPSGTPNVLDVPRTVLDKVMDASVPLALIEGERKADHLASRRVAVVCLFGVWNWSNKVEEGTPYETQLLLECFDRVPLRDREVAILFDCDTRINKNIQLAAYRLASKLRERGAILW